jgi:hypothetical protein
MLLTLSAGLAVAANAQGADATPQTTAPQGQGQWHGHHHGPMNPEFQTKMLTRKLGLTEQQAQAVEPILAARDQQIKALHQSTQNSAQSGTPVNHAAMRQQMQSIQQSTDQQLASIFTQQQEQQYQQMEQHRKHWNHGQQNGAPSSSPSSTQGL